MQERNSKNEKAYDLSSFKVLTVDDFPFITDLVASTLREMGVGTILRANDGQKAKEAILQHNHVENVFNNIDVVLLDWLMPGINGASLLSWIRSHEKETIKFLPVIVCSAFTSSDLVSKARDFGANEVLVKPLSAEKLAHRIQYVIEHPRPFVKSPEYFGPNRRRKKEPFKKERRVNKDTDIKQTYEKQD